MTAAKKTAETDQSDEQEQQDEAPKSTTLTEGFGRETDQRENGDVHVYTFADGTSAKVWTLEGDKTHVGVQLRNALGRGTTGTTYESVTINQANTLVESAGVLAQESVDAQAKLS